MESKKHSVLLIFLYALTILSICLPFLADIIKSPITRTESCIILGCVSVLFFVVSFFQIKIFMSVQKQNIIPHSLGTQNFECKHDGRKQCCVTECLRLLKQNDKIKGFISDKTLEDYKLKTAENMNKFETAFNEDDNEVWVFSYDLASEVLGDSSQNIAIGNMKKGVKYVEFFLDNQKNHGRIEKNKYILLNNIPTKSRDKVEFVPIKEIPIKENSGDEINILSRLFGSIIFIEKKEDHPMEITSFFSLRGDGGFKKDPIYFKMPSCMRDGYYNYFKSIYDNNKGRTLT